MDFKKLKKVLLTLSIAACLALPMSACVGGGNEDGAGNGTSTEQPGDDNTGDDNTGDDNTGDDNTGDDNTGDDNTGDDNTGDDNTGDDNTGDDNTGDDNTGDDNTGDDNTGDDNTGDDNVEHDCADTDNNHKCDTCGETLSQCADTDNNHKCDTCGETLSQCADNNKDHKCDTCGETLSYCADNDNNHDCDICGETLSQCADNDKDHKCDTCGETVSQCADNDKNHKCDTCGETLSQCADNDKNHKCDTCGETVSECADDNKDHDCDICGKELSECADNDKDHKCDTCGETLSQCADNDKNHKCDTCGENVGEHEGTDTSHVCEYCGKVVSACVDEDANDYCDVCGNKMHVCVDSDNDHLCDTCQFELTSCINNNKDHKCDICGETVSECADDNKDHKCDTCEETVSQCADDDKDHNCDVCDKELSQCADNDKDHKCDTCGETISECADNDKNHKCDTCGETISECADNDKNHKCDICGETISQCADDNKDHKCDTCGETLSQCADNNKDHNCDVCDKELSQCADTDNNHKCDTCGETVSQCADDNKDHQCDTCGETVSECADDNKDHKCDTCGETVSQCADDDKDHNCDVCDKELSQCADDNKDHKCDTCGETLSQCADTDNNHKCDTCGETLSQCADTDNNHKCDTCGETVSQCADNNKDHKCDTCGETVSQCADNDNNHKCDTCGETLSECVDENKDHVCDICGEVDEVTGISVSVESDYEIKPSATIEDVKALLTVTATRNSDSTETVTDYSIAGDIQPGECAFVVSYAGFSETITITFTLVDVEVEVEAGRDIRVLQITDTQIIDCSQSKTGDFVDYAWYANRMDEELFRYIKDAIERTDPDLIVLTGDLIFGKFDYNGTAFQALIAYMESFQIPWAPVFGNHENESPKGVDWQCTQLENAEYCLFQRGSLTDTNGNYTVGVTQGGELVRVFYMMDTNGCGAAYNKEGDNGVTETGGFTQEQINWLGDGMKEFNEYYPNAEISLCFHIPTNEAIDAVKTYGNVDESFAIGIDKTAKNGDFGEYRDRMVSAKPAPNYNGQSFLSLLQNSGVDSVFMGHDHSNNFSILYGGIRWTYGLKTGRYDEIYVDNLGGTLITFNDSAMDIRHVYYNEEYQAEMDAVREGGTYTKKKTWTVKATDKHLAVETKTTDADQNGKVLTLSANTKVGDVTVPAGTYLHLNLAKGVGARFANFANRYERGKTYELVIEGYGITYDTGNLLLLYSSRAAQSSETPNTANLSYQSLGNGLYRVKTTFVAKDTYTIGWYNTSGTAQEWYITSMTLTEAARNEATFTLGETINFSDYTTSVTNDGSMSTTEWVNSPAGDYTIGLHVTAKATSGSMARFVSLGTPVMKTGTKYKITWVSTDMGNTSSMVVLNFKDSDKPVATPIEGTSLYRYTYVSTTSSSFQYIVLYNLPNGIARDFVIYELTCEEVMECADENGDHKCDTCGETLSQCVDENNDDKCDICGAQWVEPIATPVLSVEGRTVTWDAQEGVTYKYRIAGGADQVATGNSITAYYNDVVSVWAVGDNVTTLDSEVASITIPAAAEVYPTMEQLEAGYTFDWDKNYVGVTQGSQIPVARVQNAAAKESMKASEDFGDYAMYLALGDQHNFMGILRDKGAITPGYTYTITVNYYCVTDNGGDYVIALGDGNANKTLVENPFKTGLNAFTFEWIPSDVQFCLTFWTNGPALDVYLGNIEVKVTKPAVVYTEVVPTLDQAKAGFTYDWENNYMAIGGGKVEEVATFTNADAKTAIQGASEGFGNVVMHVTSTGGACDLTTLTKAKNADLFQVGWTYTFEIDYYAVSVGANYMIAYNGGANNTFCGNPFKVGLNKATIQYTVGQNENMLTLYGTFDMYIGNFKLVYAEPASSGDMPTAVLTASQLNVGLDGEIVATPTGAAAQKGFGEQAVKYTQASLNGQAISEIYQLPSKVTTGLKVTIYYYVESFTGNLLLCLGAHDPFFALDASAGYHEVTVTIPANYEIQYLCWHGSGCTSAEFYIGSIEYYVLNA